MIKKFFTLTLILCASVALAQPPAEPEENCYVKYAKAFEERGANDPTDGWYDNVVITVRKGTDADCFIGRVRILKDTISDIFIKFTDGEAERFQKRMKKFDKPTTVVNGISTTMVSFDDELVNIIFTDLLKPKKKAYQKAPLPKLD